MALQTLNSSAIANLPLLDRGQKIVWDAKLKGFGIRLTKTTKTFICEARVKGRTRRVSICRDRVRQFVEQRIAEPHLGVSEIARAAGLSKWKLQSSLQAEGTSVSVIREAVRRTLAIERVTGTADSVGSIATDLGYTNNSNFTRAFRKWTGKSPREVRRDL